MKLDLGEFKNIESISYRNEYGEPVEIPVNDWLAINEDDLVFDNQANHYYVIATLEAKAKLLVENQKLVINKTQGDLFYKYSHDKDAIAENNGKRLSQNELNNRIMSDNSLLSEQTKLNRLNFIQGNLKQLLLAMQQRKDLLQTIASNKRAESKLSGQMN